MSLVAECAPRLARRGVHLMAMHPGWTDTPGLRSSLPRFHRIMGPQLRSAREGADTIVWLASAPVREIGPGPLWLDRRSRAVHRLPRTARSDTVEQRRLLLEECRRRRARGAASLSGPRMSRKRVIGADHWAREGDVAVRLLAG